MPAYSSKLIIIRGNSGSGKSSIAKRIRAISPRKIALVEQDNIRRTILKEKETDDGANIALIAQIVEFALARDYDVVLEGMLKFHRYGEMLRSLVGQCADHSIYYLDIPFDETLRRHATKPIAQEVGADQLRSWYLPRDTTDFPGEIIIGPASSLDDSARQIIQHAGL